LLIPNRIQTVSHIEFPKDAEHNVMATTQDYSSQPAGSDRARWPRLGSPAINMSETERTLSIVGGAALALYGLSRMPKGSLILLAGGLYAVYRGVKGHCDVYEQLGIDHGELSNPGAAEGGQPRI
jgi:uncharacterized membrane protein